MDARKFLELYGKERAKEVAERAGTTWQYFYQIATGRRRPSVEKAQDLVKASDGELGLMAMLTAPRKALGPQE